MFGAQAGGDIWWNIHSGVRLGMGLKGAWVQNEIKRSFNVAANSIELTLPSTIRDEAVTLMGEFELKFIWPVQPLMEIPNGVLRDRSRGHWFRVESTRTPF